MMPLLFFLLIIAFLGTVVYVYLKREQDKIITREKDEKYIYNVFQTLKHHHPPLLVGFGVASVHFTILFLLARGSISLCSTNLLAFFIAPSYAFVYSPSFFSINNDLFGIFLSSCFYGLAGGLSVSRQKTLQSIGLMLTCMILFFGCYLGMMMLFSCSG